MENILFIHIPKTAGTSLSQTLFKKGLNNKWNRNLVLMNHDPLFLLQEYNTIPKECFVFSIVRNPFTRAFSSYQYYMKTAKTYCFNENLEFWSFEFFLEAIRTNKNIFFTPITKSTQSWFLRDKDNNISVNKIYKFENLQELENDLNIVLPKHNVGKYSEDDYKNAYNDKTISLVQEIYKEDFINFNYPIDSF
jgi:hypothetical protein